MNEKTKALQLADALDAVNTNNADSLLVQMTARSAATELRRLNAEYELLRAQIGQGVPDGWQLVPKEPTQEMFDAGDGTFECSYTGTPTSSPARVWVAMLASAPSAPQQKPMTEHERAIMYSALSCVELQEKDPATMFKMIVEGVERFHNIGE